MQETYAQILESSLEKQSVKKIELNAEDLTIQLDSNKDFMGSGATISINKSDLAQDGLKINLEN